MSVEWRDRGIVWWSCASIFVAVLPWSATPADAQAPAAHAARTAADARVVVRQTGTEIPALDAASIAARVRVDGRLDDDAWRDARVAGGFRQRAPTEGAAASQATEVRVLFDDVALYVGARLADSAPDSIDAPLGRRDQHPPSDEFFVHLDSYKDRRNGFVFAVTPSGVITDMRLTNGAEMDASWDAVWSAATQRDSAGWSVEMRIPLNQLPFTSARGARGTRVAEWGVNFERYLNRRGETSQWALVPQTAPVWVPYWGTLRMTGLAGGRGRLQVAPYVLGSVRRLPPADVSPLAPRVAQTHTVGADARFVISPAWVATAAVNPDFGQVEADPAMVNLTALELFFPERRPFFVAGSEAFRLRMNSWYDQTAELFYSRRIGRAPQLELPDDAGATDAPVATPIRAAVKLTGRTASGWTIGLLDAEAGAVRGRWVDGDGATRAMTVEPATNTFVGRATRDLRDGQTTFSVMGTAVHRRLDADADTLLRRAAYTGGVDLLHRAGGYELQAFAVGSVVRGSAPAIRRTQRASSRLFQRPDATHLGVDSSRTSLAGWGGMLRAAKTGGRWHWELTQKAYSPGFEPNDAGYLAQSDRALTFAHVDFTQPPRADAAVRSWWLAGNAWHMRDLSGELLGTTGEIAGQVQSQDFWTATGWVGGRPTTLQPDALRGGPAWRRAPRGWVGGELESDVRRRLSAALLVNAWGETQTGTAGREARLTLTARPNGRAELSMAPQLAASREAAQWVGRGTRGDGSTAWVLGTLEQRTASVTVRGSLAFTPLLTLQLYAQPFVSVGRFSRLGEVGAPRSPAWAERLVPFAPGALVPTADGARWQVATGDPLRAYSFDRPDFATRSAIVNAVLRWDYRPGSSLFVVLGHDRLAEDPSAVAAGRDWRDGAAQLLDVAGRTQLSVKLSYWFAR